MNNFNKITQYDNKQFQLAKEALQTICDQIEFGDRLHLYQPAPGASQ